MDNVEILIATVVLLQLIILMLIVKLSVSIKTFTSEDKLVARERAKLLFEKEKKEQEEIDKLDQEARELGARF
jgi:uncharacterized protein YlxW (UPF0749 family)